VLIGRSEEVRWREQMSSHTLHTYLTYRRGYPYAPELKDFSPALGDLEGPVSTGRQHKTRLPGVHPNAV